MSEGADPRNVGEQLAAERARQQLELSDVAARTRIPLRHLDAIEKGVHDGLPALPYSAGFVKSYANMLGLDGQGLSRAFRDQLGGEQRAYFEPEAYEPVDPTRVPSRLLAMVALGVALLLGMAYLLLRFEGDSSDLAKLAADTVQDIRPAPAQQPPPVAVPAEPAIPTGPISVTASEDAWIKISERAGPKTYFMDVLVAGQSFTMPDDAVDPILRTGRPQSLKVLIGTTELPPVAEPDRLVRDYSLKRDALLAIATAKPETAVPEAANASDAGAVPEAYRNVPPVYDPSTGRAVTAGPTSDSDRRPQP
jgi:cytoskeleton protein RodZ